MKEPSLYSSSMKPVRDPVSWPSAHKPPGPHVCKLSSVELKPYQLSSRQEMKKGKGKTCATEVILF